MQRQSLPSETDQNPDRHQPPLHHSGQTLTILLPDNIPPHHSKPLTSHNHHYPFHRSDLNPPPIKRTSPLAWFAAIFCAVLWIIIILGGIIVLIVYLILRPRNPQLDIPQATLNAAYLDTDIYSNVTLLNADLTLLANFSNPNHKIDIVFTLLALDLYFETTLVAAAAVDPFAERRGESTLRSVHMVSSQVALSGKEAEEWRRQEEERGIVMEMRGAMKTRSQMRGFLRFTYWLHCKCRIVLGAPPGGVSKDVRCRTKR